MNTTVMQTCADELAPIFSTLPVLLENLRAARYQLGVDSYLRVERLLLQLAAQGQLSLEPAQLKTQLLAVLRPLLCHSPLEQQQFSQHFEHWWQLVHASPASNPSISIETVKPKSRNKQHFLILILFMGLLCSIVYYQYLRPSETQTTLQSPIEPTQPKIPPSNPTTNQKPLENKQTEIPPPQAVNPLVALPKQSINNPSNTKLEDIYNSLIITFILVLSGLLLFLIRTRQKTQQFLNRYAVTETLTTQTLFVSQLQKQLFHTLELGQLAQRLRIRETLASTDLNISATIAKTLQAGNYFSPVYAERKRTPEYLILVDKQSFSDHHAALVDSLVARLQSEGVEITRYYFHGNPELCYQNSYQGVKLARLFALHGESRLLIFSDGAGLLDVMGELHSWLKDLLSWQVHCVLTLHDLRGWAAQALLRANFWVLPASESGLRGLVSLLHPQSATTRLQWDGSPMSRYLEERPLRWLTREKPSVAEEQELLQQLRKFLGKEGFEWLCACAVWHEVRWQMTLFFGYQLFGQDTAAISARLALLARLARLVWFKTGFMPDWLRRSLLAELSPAQKKLLRNSLFTLFGSAALEPAADSMPIKIAQQAPVKKWRQTTENQLNDVVFLEFSLVSSLAVPVPKMVRVLLGRQVSTRHTLWLTLGLIGLVFYQALELYKTEFVVLSEYPKPVKPKPISQVVWGINSASFSPDGKKIVTASLDKTAHVWDSNTGKSLVVLQGHSEGVNSASFSPDGTKIVTASLDKTARVWDSNTGKSLATFHGHSEGVNSASFNQSYFEEIVTASLDKTARVWDGKDMIGKLLSILQGHSAGVNSASFNRNIMDSTKIVTASLDKTARVWDSSTGKSLVVLQGHSEGVNSASFSPDDTKIVTASLDKTARVWNSNTGKSLVVLQGHSEGVNSASFSPDGTKIVTASLDKTAHVWDSSTGKPLVVLQGHSEGVNSASFSPDGKKIVTASLDKTARVWDSSTGKSLVILQENAINPMQQYSIPSELTHQAFEPEMIRIPSGTFRMGSNDNDIEKPLHFVLVEAFYMSKYETTVDQFKTFVKDSGYSGSEVSYDWKCKGFMQPTFSQTEQDPVVCVTWLDAVAYGEWLSKKTGKNYRLPTEAEWEYAARGGSPTDDHITSNHWGEKRTAHVGSFSPNGFALYDMLGNVWEWTCSEYGAYSEGKEIICNQLVNGRRVLRGGSWDSKAYFLDFSRRNYLDTTERGGHLGFRLISH